MTESLVVIAALALGSAAASAQPPAGADPAPAAGPTASSDAPAPIGADPDTRDGAPEPDTAGTPARPVSKVETSYPSRQAARPARAVDPGGDLQGRELQGASRSGSDLQGREIQGVLVDGLEMPGGARVHAVRLPDGRRLTSR